MKVKDDTNNQEIKKHKLMSFQWSIIAIPTEF